MKQTDFTDILFSTSPKKTEQHYRFPALGFFSGCLLNLNKNPCVYLKNVGESIAPSERTSPTWRKEKYRKIVIFGRGYCLDLPSTTHDAIVAVRDATEPKNAISHHPDHQGWTRLLIRTLARRPFLDKKCFFFALLFHVGMTRIYRCFGILW